MEAVSVRRHISRYSTSETANSSNEADHAVRRTSSKADDDSDAGSRRTSTEDGSTSSGDTRNRSSLEGQTVPSRETGQDSTRSSINPAQAWQQHQLPGGRRLWNRLVIGFAVVAALGAVFITVGAVYCKPAKEWSDRENLSMPFVLCIIAIVMGALFIGGSVFLGKLIISDKWRKNEQPNYRNMATATVRYRSPVANSQSGVPLEAEVEIQMQPPSYEASANDPTTPPQSIFVISGHDININMSPNSGSANKPPPPEYTEISGVPPPAYSENPTVSPTADSGDSASSPGVSEGHSIEGSTSVPACIELREREDSVEVDLTQIQRVLTGRSVSRSGSSSASSTASVNDGYHSRSLSVVSHEEGTSVEGGPVVMPGTNDRDVQL